MPNNNVSNDLAFAAGVPTSQFGAAGAGMRTALQQRLQTYLQQLQAQREQDQQAGLAQLIKMIVVMHQSRQGVTPGGRKPNSIMPAPGETFASNGTPPDMGIAGLGRYMPSDRRPLRSPMAGLPDYNQFQIPNMPNYGGY